MQVVPSPDFMVFTGNANPALAAEIAGHLGIALGAASIGRFSDGEVTVEINTVARADLGQGRGQPAADGGPGPDPVLEARRRRGLPWDQRGAGRHLRLAGAA